MKKVRDTGLKQAAALKYDAAADEEPRIVGLGMGVVAQNMIEQAEINDIPVVQDDDIANTLLCMGIGDDIPQELYQVIAEILVFIAKLDAQPGQRYNLEEAEHRLKK